jgi:hypothetical protein
MILTKMFGYTLAAIILLSGAALLWLREKWQKIEEVVYTRGKKPVWLWAPAAVALVFYAVVVWSFVTGPKLWAGWVLVLAVPAAWLVKTMLSYFFPTLRETVPEGAGSEVWRREALARVPAVILLLLLTYLA